MNTLTFSHIMGSSTLSLTASISSSSILTSSINELENILRKRREFQASAIIGVSIYRCRRLFPPNGWARNKSSIAVQKDQESTSPGFRRH